MPLARPWFAWDPFEAGTSGRPFPPLPGASQPSAHSPTTHRPAGLPERAGPFPDLSPPPERTNAQSLPAAAAFPVASRRSSWPPCLEAYALILVPSSATWPSWNVRMNSSLPGLELWPAQCRKRPVVRRITVRQHPARRCPRAGPAPTGGKSGCSGARR